MQVIDTIDHFVAEGSGSVTYTHTSCGMKQLVKLTPRPEEGLKRAMSWAGANFKHMCPFYVFSDHNFQVRQDHKTGVKTKISFGEWGKKLAAYIIDQKLGTIVETDVRYNPNSGNHIQAWIWAIDHKALTVWCAARGIKNCNDYDGPENFVAPVNEGM